MVDRETGEVVASSDDTETGGVVARSGNTETGGVAASGDGDPADTEEPAGLSRTSSPSTDVPPPQTREDLGEKVIEGLTARGGRHTMGSETTEVWLCREIDQPALFVHVTGPGYEKTERLFNIKLGDPDPALFALLDEAADE